MKKQQSDKVILSTNRKALHDYFIEEHYEAGIVLTGSEVKSCVNKEINLQNAYIQLMNNKLVIHKMFISRYKNAYKAGFEDEDRDRTLLMHKKEILKLAIKLGKARAVGKAGYTLIPLSCYMTNIGFIKIEIGLARGKHNYDKRAALKEKQIKRDLQHEFK